MFARSPPDRALRRQEFLLMLHQRAGARADIPGRPKSLVLRFLEHRAESDGKRPATLRNVRPREQANQTRHMQDQQRRQLGDAQRAQREGRPAPRGTSAEIVKRSSDRIVFSNGVAKRTRPLTAAEISRGYTGKMTGDGRALV